MPNLCQLIMRSLSNYWVQRNPPPTLQQLQSLLTLWKGKELCFGEWMSVRRHFSVSKTIWPRLLSLVTLICVTHLLSTLKFYRYLNCLGAGMKIWHLVPRGHFLWELLSVQRRAKWHWTWVSGKGSCLDNLKKMVAPGLFAGCCICRNFNPQSIIRVSLTI